MNKEQQNKTWLGWAVLLLLLGVVNFFSSGRWVFAPAAWVATIFALRYLHGQTGWRPWLPFFLVLWLSTALAWVEATPMPGIAHWIFMAVNILFGLLPFVVERWLVRRWATARAGDLPFVATLIFPTVMVIMEFLTSTSNPIGNFGVAGYSQFGFAPFVQLTAVTGMLGLTFMMAWFASVVNWAWTYHQFVWGKVQKGVAVYTAVLLLILTYGTVRLWTAPTVESQPTVPLAGFTLHPFEAERLMPLFSNDLDAFRAETQARHADYLAETAVAAQNGAKIIVWPEGAGLGTAADVADLLAQGQELAREQGIYLAMPIFTLFPPEENRLAENILHIADPTGEIVLSHVKYGGNIIEGSLAGSGELQMVETPYGTLSGIIWWDTDFPATVRQAGEMGVDILLSPAREWPGIDPMHGEMATFRALENGLTVVRVADGGWSLIGDAHGRVLSDSPSEISYLTGSAPTQGMPTLYAQFGDWLGWVSLALFLFLAGWSVLVGRRTTAVARS